MHRIMMVIPASALFSSLALGQTVESSLADLVSADWTVSARGLSA
jgi:hypothetical protein